MLHSTESVHSRSASLFVLIVSLQAQSQKPLTWNSIKIHGNAQECRPVLLLLHWDRRRGRDRDRRRRSESWLVKFDTLEVKISIFKAGTDNLKLSSCHYRWCNRRKDNRSAFCLPQSCDDQQHRRKIWVY